MAATVGLSLGAAIGEPGLGQSDPFGPGGDPFPPGFDDPFGGSDGNPFAGEDPFGWTGDDPVADPNPVADPGAAWGGGTSHVTIRLGPGRPALAVEPSLESGAIQFDVNTPVGLLPILVQPAGPDRTLTLPPPIEPRPFRPPSVFSAPLPTGSGARALGFSGAFTAIADDATAASWNPAGLIHLKRPEVSLVYRNAWFRNHHTSADPDLSVGTDDYHSHGLNYLTAAIPFRVPGVGLNAVASLNYQEAYDFVSAFSAGFTDRGRQRFSRENAATFTETQIDRFTFEPGGLRSNVEVTSQITTRSTSRLRQTIDTEVAADLQFRQDGIIDALSPALALELTPRFAVGCAVNHYQDGLFDRGGIRSTARSTFTATSTSRAEIRHTRRTGGSYIATESTTLPGGGAFGPGDVVVESEPTQGRFPEVTSEQTTRRTEVRRVEGEIREENRYQDLDGWNATLGFWWVVNDALTVAASVDLPWSADTRQTRSVRTATTTFDPGRAQVLGSTQTEEHSSRDVDLEFPLFGTAGALLVWSPNLYTALDVGFAQWSEFAYDVQGEGRINPFDGSPHRQSPVGDTWSARLGVEYLHRLASRPFEVPLRAGLVWEQRPAIGTPDDYYGFSLGTGIALGRAPRQWILDLAYRYLRGDDVQGVLPDQPALSTDTRQHQVFLSIIKHL